MPRRQRGRSWLELAVAAGVIATLFGFLLAALQDLQASGEKTIIDLTVRNMRTGLQLRIGELMLANKTREIPQLVGQNPVQWLAQPPEGYLGEFDAPPADPPPRSWHFDRSTQTLAYRPGTAGFAATAGDPGPLAWRVEPGGGLGDGGVRGVRLAPVPRQAAR